MKEWWQWLLLTVVALLIPASFMFSDSLAIQLGALVVFLTVAGGIYYLNNREARR
jgi:hypothetical protein